MLKKLLNFLKSKMFIVGFLIFIQLAVIMGLVFTLSEHFLSVYSFLLFLSVMMSIYILNKDDNPSYKMAWIVSIVALPIFGGLVYLLFGGQKVPKALRKRDHDSQEEIAGFIIQEQSIMDDLKRHDPSAFKQANYIWRNADFPIYQHTATTFFPIGEAKFEEMVKQLKQAKTFIFLEYFIIEEGIMWNTILDVLIQKVHEGVDVRVMYDDAGCISKLPDKYYLKLRSMGIKAKVFNPIEPRLAMQMNNRDHRKILVIDGKVGITGGMNLADEYINLTSRFGHWKDCAVMIEGAAVWNFTLMFLQFWNYDEKIKDNFLDYKIDIVDFLDIENDGYVQPFSDSPTDNEHVGEYTHINMINSANHYVYIQTPYLVLDQEMKTSLILAAKNGVDVRIMVPHIPDKWYVFALTQANYQSLIQSGVKIYEYTPGFVHAKTFVVDDKMAIIGTVNMDYRSYYLHYEDGVYFYRSKVVGELKSDYLDTLSKCQQITLEDIKKVSWFKRLVQGILNIFAPMM